MLRAGERVNLAEVGLFSDGTAVKLVGEETFRLCREYLDEVILVDTDAVCAAIKDVFLETRSVLEPAGALALAGLKRYVEREGLSGRSLVAITSGANMNFDRMRFVADRADVGEAREAAFAVTLPEERGSFRRFCAVIGQRNVTEFNYRIADERRALRRRADRAPGRGCRHLAVPAGRRLRRARSEPRRTVQAAHPLHGRRPLAAGDGRRLFEFPERPGALMKFVGHGAELEHQSVPLPQPGRGFQLGPGRHPGAAGGRDGAGRFPGATGLRPFRETDNPAYRQFLAEGRTAMAWRSGSRGEGR